ncbi:MAG: dihydrofolate reductase [Peptostreptococcales bacterium]
MEKEINLIVAKSSNNVIGNNNELLWKIPNDLKYFKKVTTNSVVIMGRKTFESIGKILPNRLNVIISKQSGDLKQIYKGCKNCLFFDNYIDMFLFINDQEFYKNIFVIGGGEVYKYFIENNLINKYYITEIKQEFEGDTYFPNVDLTNYKKETVDSGEYNGLNYEFNVYQPLIGL